MKINKVAIVFAVMLLILSMLMITPLSHAKTVYIKTALTGGSSTSLDGVNGSTLTDGDVAYCYVSGIAYTYVLDADSAAAESSPAIIAPDNNPGDKRWILQEQTTAGLNVNDLAASVPVETDASKNIVSGTKTGTGSVYVMQSGATLITPTIGAATGTSLNLSSDASANRLYSATDIRATTGMFTNLTDGYVPYHSSDTAGLVNSPIYTNGTNVGIGTTNPEALLHIYKSTESWIDVQGSTSNRAKFGISGNDVYIGGSSSSGKLYLVMNASSSDNPSSGTKLMTLQNDGYVGIGTTEPGAQLEIKAAATANAVNILNAAESYAAATRYDAAGVAKAYVGRGTVSGSNDLELYSVTGQNIRFYPGGDLEKVRMDGSGNVGIGTSTFGTSAAKVLAMYNSTAPTTSPADTTQVYSANLNGTDGKARLHMTTEDGYSGGIALLEPNVNLLSNSGFGVWSNATLAEATTGATPVTDGDNAALTAGGNLITNGGVDSDTTSWPDNPNASFASVAGGKTGNCLQLTRLDGSDQNATQTVSGATVGKLYLFSFYVKSGTSGDESFQGRLDSDIVISGTTSGSWVLYSALYKATATDINITLRKNTATAGTMLFDSITLYEVTPACIAADALGPDGMSKTSTLDTYREYGSAYINGLYGIKTTKGADTAEYLNLSSRSDEAWYKQFRGRTVTMGCYIYSTTATDNVKLQINDSDGTTESSFIGADTLMWVEITRTCGASITSFTPRILFDGDTSDIAYVSKVMLKFGNAIGEGNYSPKPNDIIYLEAPITLTDYNASTGTTDATVNIEAQSSGKVPKGVKALKFDVTEKSTGVADGDGLRIQTSSTNTAGFSTNPQVNNITMPGNGDVGADVNGDVYFNFTNTGGGTLTSTVKINAVQL